jgi:four helix bundle protein
MVVESYKDLLVWQKSIDLACDVYSLTRHFPRDERFGMTAQVRRSTVSISSNIAEGNGRATTADYLNFLSHSRGSLFETDSLLVLSGRLEFADSSDLDHLFRSTDEISRMLAGLRTSLKKRL